MEKGLLYNFTGNGKGKTSAALGVALRALGYGWKVAVLQFMKSGRETGERLFFRQYFPDTFFEGCGLGRTCRPGDHAGYAREGWRTASKLLKEFDGELLILDEAHSARVSKDISGSSKKTQVYSMLESVSSKIPHIILATATPMQKEAGEYHSLLKLLGLKVQVANSW